MQQRKRGTTAAVRKNLVYVATTLDCLYRFAFSGCCPEDVVHTMVFSFLVGQTQECEAHVPNDHLSRLASAEHDLPLQLVALSDTELLHRCDSSVVHT